MRRKSIDAAIDAELTRLTETHLRALLRERPGITFELAHGIAWRRMSRELGLSRIEIARAAANYRDYVAAHQSRSKNRKKGAR